MKFSLPQVTAIRILSIALCLGIPGVLMAQSSSDTNSGPPPGPLLKRTPDRSIWVVTIKGDPADESQGGAASSLSGEQQSAVVAQSKVMKSGDTIYEQNTDPHGRIDQIWEISGVKAEKSANSSDPIVGPASGGGGDIYSVNFVNSDFAGLDWISADTYQGKMKYQGRDVLMFKKEMNTTSSDVNRENEIAIANAKAIDAVRALKGIKAAPVATPPPAKLVPAVATIDLETRLPLIVTFGGQTRVYQYFPLNSAIPIPSDVSKAVSDYQQRMKLLSP